MKREELIAYDKWLTRRKWGTGEIISPEKAADLYLAEQPLPPAEGAEEILRKNCNTCYSRSTGEEEVWSSVSSVLIAMQDFATLHAQRIADKMVSERYEIAIKALETIHHAYYTEGESAEEQVVDLRSIALKALEEIDNLKTR